MHASATPEEQFLIAAGLRNPDLLPSNSFDEALLLDLLAEHKLLHRAELFLQSGLLRDWPSLEGKITALCKVSRTDFARNFGKLQEIHAQTGLDSHLVLKGFTTYLHTDDHATLRSGDIDIAISQPDELISYLLTDGFVQTRTPFMHEIGEYSRDGIECDLQWGFPVYTYPQSLSNTPHAALFAGQLMESQLLDFAYLKEHSEICETDTGRARIVIPEMAVLIAASHAYMNYTNIWSISHREKTWLRLGELADIVDLTQLRSFDFEKFDALVMETGAVDIMRWLGACLMHVFDQATPEQLRKGPDRLENFPLNLWWNLWTALPPQRDKFLQKQWYPQCELQQIIKDSPLTFAIQTQPETGSCALMTTDQQPLEDIRIGFQRENSRLTMTAHGDALASSDVLRVRHEQSCTAEEYARTGANLTIETASGRDGFFLVAIERNGQIRGNRILHWAP